MLAKGSERSKKIEIRQIPGEIRQIPGEIRQIPGEIRQIPGELRQIPGVIHIKANLYNTVAFLFKRHRL